MAYKYCPHCGKPFIEPDEPRTIGAVLHNKTFLTWTQIKEWSDKGEAAQHFEIGDELHDTLTTGEPITLVVVEKDWPQKGSVVLQLKDCLAERYSMNPTNTNKGGWEESQLRKVLHTAILNTFPQDIRDCIKPLVRGSVEDILWLPTEVQVFGEAYWSDKEKARGCAQFAYYRRPGNRVKCLGEGGDRCNWWLASPCASNTASFCYVSHDGLSSYCGASDSFGVAPGFCI